MLFAASLVDLRQRRIPNSLTYTAIGICTLAVGLGTLFGEDPRVIAGLVGGALFGSLLVVPRCLKPGSMGLGDVKLALPLGFAIGWTQANVLDTVLAVGWSLAAASLLGLAMAVAAAASRGERARAGQEVPFGPALGLAAFGAVVLAVF